MTSTFCTFDRVRRWRGMVIGVITAGTVVFSGRVVTRSSFWELIVEISKNGIVSIFIVDINYSRSPAPSGSSTAAASPLAAAIAAFALRHALVAFSSAVEVLSATSTIRF